MFFSFKWSAGSKVNAISIGWHLNVFPAMVSLQSNIWGFYRTYICVCKIKRKLSTPLIFYLHLQNKNINSSQILGFSSSSPGRARLSSFPFDFAFSSHLLPSLPSFFKTSQLLPYLLPIFNPPSLFLLILIFSPLLPTQTTLWISERARTKTSTFPFMSSSPPQT